jgi:hypothetical protein
MTNHNPYIDFFTSGDEDVLLNIEPLEMIGIRDYIYMILFLSSGEIIQNIYYIWYQEYNSFLSLSNILCLTCLIAIRLFFGIKELIKTHDSISNELIYYTQLLILCIHMGITFSLFTKELSMFILVAFVFSSIINIITLVNIHKQQKNKYKTIIHQCKKDCSDCPCFICTEKIDKIIHLPCNHMIHASCFIKWSEEWKRPICPYCRTSIKEEYCK